MDYSLDPLEEQDALFDLAMALRAVAGNLAGANCSITRQPSAQGIHHGSPAPEHYAGNAGARQRP
jgi:hypothetical protein